MFLRKKNAESPSTVRQKDKRARLHRALDRALDSKKQTYQVGQTVRFEFSWYGKSSPHDGHLCRVLQASVDRVNGRNYYRYVLEDLEADKLPARAGKIFKMTDTSANGTTLEEA